MNPSLNPRGLGWALTLALAIGCSWPGHGQHVSGGGQTEQLNANILNAEFTPAATGRWNLLHSGRPAARLGHQAVSTDDELILTGGTQNLGWISQPSRDGRLNPVTGNWVSIPPLGPHGASVLWTGKEILVWAGDSEGASIGYNPKTRVRRRLSKSGAPGRREGHSMIWTGKEMIIWGGHDGNELVNTGARYNPNEDRWTPTALNPALIRRSSHSAVWTGSEMIVWGGAAGNPTGCCIPIQQGARYNPESDSWTGFTTTGNAPIASYGHSATWTGAEMLIIGGTKDRPGLPNGKRYDPVADRWREIATNSLARGRSGHTAIADGSGVFVFGGGENSVWRYDVVADSWSNIPEDNGPKAFYGASITKVGNEVVVWGGYDFRTVRADGARLDLASMSWKPLSSFVPHGNDKPTAVWTGEAFFVSAGSFGVFDLSRRSWLETDVAGGQGGGSFIWAGTMALLWGGRTGPDFGLQYHNGGWELAPDGVPLGYFAAPGVIPPSGRAFHSAIWTGSEMIVWGGKNSRRLFADGAKWSASTRSWAPIQANNAPSARINHSAVWTGASMIIWGGETDAESSLTGITVGGIYSPDSDSWEILGGPLSTVGHTAVWTGSEMLVWGGIKAGTPPVVSGNAYRPHGRLWHRLPLDSASTAVQGHSAVWTGKEMIVWGGLNSRGEPLGEGARYNPSQGRWYPMPLSSPSPRANHAAAWTGDRMLIWGGSGGGSFGDTWEYLPPGDAEPTSDLITLRWSVTAEQHRLQFTPSLTEPDWRDVPDSPTQTNSVWTVTLPAPMSSGAAFRLIAE